MREFVSDHAVQFMHLNLLLMPLKSCRTICDSTSFLRPLRSLSALARSKLT